MAERMLASRLLAETARRKTWRWLSTRCIPRSTTRSRSTRVPSTPRATRLLRPRSQRMCEQGGLRYDRNINPKLFAFGAADFQANALQFLDLRQVYTGGLGYHAIKSDATTLNFLGGINFTHETYSNGALIPGHASGLRVLRRDQQIRCAYPGRRTHAQAGQEHGGDAEFLFLS